jgi:hypothetical protein
LYSYLPLRSPQHGTRICSAISLRRKPPGKADAAWELWQTECLFGTVFALRLSFECGKRARRDGAGRRFELLPVTKIIGYGKNR